MNTLERIENLLTCHGLKPVNAVNHGWTPPPLRSANCVHLWNVTACLDEIDRATGEDTRLTPHVMVVKSGLRVGAHVPCFRRAMVGERVRFHEHRLVNKATSYYHWLGEKADRYNV